MRRINLSQPILLKVYGYLSPVLEPEFHALTQIGQLAFPGKPDEPWARLQKDLLTVSFEGIAFPMEETLGIIRAYLAPGQNGKLDELDLERWQLTRHIICDSKIHSHSAPLNNVLAYSGH